RGGIQLLDLRACDRGLPVADAEHLGDSRGCDLVIAGYHRNSDSTVVAFLDGLDGLLARRVEQADKAQQNKGPGQVGRTETASPQVRVLEPGERQHPLALGGEPV